MQKMYVKNYTKKERNGKCFMDFLSYFSEHKKNIFLNWKIDNREYNDL